MEYGLQMFSLRDITPTDLEGALRRVAEMGYRFVEFAGFFGHSAAEVRRMLDTYGLEVSGTHTRLCELAPDVIEQTIAYHKEIGNQNIIIPNADFSTKEALDHVIELINEAQPKLAAEGITLGYHNHHYEFIKTDYDCLIHHELQTRTSVDFEIDTYWAFVAGEDPIAVLERLGDRVHVIHLKDGIPGEKGTSLGLGKAPVEAVVRYAAAHGIRMVVESEGCEPSGLEEVGRCMDYLRSIDV